MTTRNITQRPECHTCGRAAPLQFSVERAEQASPRLVDVSRAYDLAPDHFKQVIEVDPYAADIVAIAHRREVVERFRRLLSDDDFFESVCTIIGGRTEAVWQRFLEENPWILGIGLTGQLLTSWNEHKLEQVVTGFSVSGSGKRTDALLRTSGSIRSLVFAEIKHHRTGLLGNSEYRSGCWAPSAELAGGVAQIQQTVELASRQIGEALPDTDREVQIPANTLTFFALDPFSYLGNSVNSEEMVAESTVHASAPSSSIAVTSTNQKFSHLTNCWPALNGM